MHWMHPWYCQWSSICPWFIRARRRHVRTFSNYLWFAANSVFFPFHEVRADSPFQCCGIRSSRQSLTMKARKFYVSSTPHSTSSPTRRSIGKWTYIQSICAPLSMKRTTGSTTASITVIYSMSMFVGFIGELSIPQECTSAGSPSPSPPTTRPLLLCSTRWIAWKPCSARAGEKEWYWASWCGIKCSSFTTCGPRYLCGDRRITEADVRLFTTLIRFDEVYVLFFKVRKQEGLHIGVE